MDSVSGVTGGTIGSVGWSDVKSPYAWCNGGTADVVAAARRWLSRSVGRPGGPEPGRESNDNE